MNFNMKTGFVLGALIITLTACSSEEKPQAQSRPMVRVTTVELVPSAVTLTSELSGRTVSSQQAEVRPQVSGIITEQAFQEGSNVKKGDLLYRIESGLYQASFDSAKASLAKAEANLNASKAKEVRTANLLRNNSVSSQDYDDANAAFLQAKADVLLAKATLKTAEINLAYTDIRAAISGSIGKSSVSVGALVTANQANALTTIYQIDPMNVDLTQSVDELYKIFSQINASRTGEDVSFADEVEVPVKISFMGEGYYKEEGVLRFADVAVDEATGTVSLRAEFANPKHTLLPGLFVRAEMEMGIIEKAILVPQRSILRDSKGKPYVYLATKSSEITAEGMPIYTAERRSVVLGDMYAEDWLVLSGLEAGEHIILGGLQKVTNNAKIIIVKEEIELISENDTTPENSSTSENTAIDSIIVIDSISEAS